MANKQTRDLGKIAAPTIPGRVSRDVPSFAVDDGDAWAALANVGGQLSSRLRDMQVKAATREGAAAGLTAGQNAGASYLQNQQVQGDAAVRIAGRAGTDLSHVNQGVITKFAALQSAFGRDLGVNSGYRSPAKNRAVGGANNSQHLHGNALDIDVSGLSQAERINLIGMASAQGFSGIGVYNNSLHLDIGNRRSWGPDFHRGSVPAWAEGAIAAHLSGGGSPSAIPASTPNPLSTQPLALRRNGTIRGDAFDGAAIRAYSWRAQTGLANDLGGAFNEFRDDPVAYNNAIAAIRAEHLSDTSYDDPQLREAFDKTFTQRVTADRLQVISAQEGRLRREEIAATGTGIDALFAEAERHAFNLGGNGDADEILAPEITRILNTIDGAEAAGTITPAQAAARRDKFGDIVATARIRGTFDALEGPTQQEGFALGLLEEWSKGQGPIAKLSYTQVHALSASLYSDARGALGRQNAQNQGEIQRVKSLTADDVLSMAATGQGVEIDVDEAKALLSPADFSNWQSAREDARQLFDATNGMESQSQTDIAQRLELLAPVEGQPGFATQQRVFEAATARALKIIEARNTDPLGQAQKSGLVELPPLDFSSPDGLASSLLTRKTDAEAVAGVYGTPITYLRPHERRALTTSLMTNPDLIPGFAVNIVEVFGEAAPQVLSEISESGAGIARGAGVYITTGDLSVISDISNVLANRADGTYKIDMPSDSAISTATALFLQGAFQAIPKEAGAVASVAQLLFEKQANIEGFKASEVNKSGTRAYEAYQQAIMRALGQRIVDGVQYGGVTQVNGGAVIVPPTMRADAPAQILGKLSEGDLVGHIPIGAESNGLPIDIGQIRAGRLVTVSDGQYRVALGDIEAGDPRYLLDENGDAFVLDLAQVAAQQNLQQALEVLAQSRRRQIERQGREDELLPPLTGMMGGAM